MPCCRPRLPESSWPACHLHGLPGDRSSRTLPISASAACQAQQTALPAPSAVRKRRFTGAVYDCYLGLFTCLTRNFASC